MTQPIVAHAQDTQDQADQQDLHIIEDRMTALQQEEAKARAANLQREKEMAAINIELRLLAADLTRLENEVLALENKITDLEQVTNDATERLTAYKLKLSKILALLQMLEQSRPPALVVNPDNAADAARMALVVGEATPNLHLEAKNLQVKLAALQGQLNELRLDRVALAEKEANIAARRNTFNDQYTEYQKANEAEAARLAKLKAENEELAKQAKTIEAYLRRKQPDIQPIQQDELQPIIQAEVIPVPTLKAVLMAQKLRADILKSQLYSQFDYNALPSSFAKTKGKLPFPVSGKITTKFGAALSGNEKSDYLMIQSRDGAVVTTPYKGQVEFAGEFGDIGKVIILKTSPSYHMVFIGLGDINIENGNVIKSGTPIGFMPQTTDDIAELRIKVLKNKVSIDPESWFLKPEIIQAAAQP